MNKQSKGTLQHTLVEYMNMDLDAIEASRAMLIKEYGWCGVRDDEYDDLWEEEDASRLEEDIIRRCDDNTEVFIEDLKIPGCNNGNYPKYKIFNNGELIAEGITCNCHRGCSNTDCIDEVLEGCKNEL